MTEYDMLVASMNRHGLDPVAVQRHGAVIVDALNRDYPDLHAWVNPSTDAVVWPPLGPIDVTIDSGLGGWSFQANADDWAPGQLAQWNRDNPSRYVPPSYIPPPVDPADPVVVPPPPPPVPSEILTLLTRILAELDFESQAAVVRQTAILAAIRAVPSGAPAAPGAVRLPGLGTIAITFTPERG